MAQIIYSMKGLTKAHGQKVVLKNVYLSYFEGAKIGVLGLNGTGKSTLLRIMAGIDQDYTGEAFVRPGTRVGYLPQEPELDPSKTVKEIVTEGVQEVADLLKEFEEITAKFSEDITPDEMEKLMMRQGDLQEKIDATDAWNLDRKIDVAMDALRCPDGDAMIQHLSGGERRRVALARLLLSQPDMLLLDEPTNHLDAESVAWLERHLDEYPGTVVAVTHDRYFLDSVAGWILELDRGETIPWEGNYSSWLEQKQKRLEGEEKSESKRKKTLQQELEWIRQNPKGRQSKSKARLSAYDQLLAQDVSEKN
jgi:energy-dependent translational throttle protein EttA